MTPKEAENEAILAWLSENPMERASLLFIATATDKLGAISRIQEGTGCWYCGGDRYEFTDEGMPFCERHPVPATGVLR